MLVGDATFILTLKPKHAMNYFMLYVSGRNFMQLAMLLQFYLEFYEIHTILYYHRSNDILTCSVGKGQNAVYYLKQLISQ